ncbi:MAG: alkaline phosphatase family protein [Hyphomicrobiaceae bacterium]
MTTHDNRFLIVVFDALRPEFVTPDLMPNLHAFAMRGACYTNCRSVFPTETRVNQTAVITGCTPARNGVVANVMMARDIWPNRVLNTGIDEQLKKTMALGVNPLICVPTLSQRLKLAGRKYASLSAGTPGGGRLINHTAEGDGTFRLAMHAPNATTPAGAFDEICAKIGPPPHFARPATAWIAWAASAYKSWIEPNVRPDVMLLWLCEPDETFHYHGIGSPPALETMGHMDSEFGEIVAALEPDLASGKMHVIAMSDHGQISLRGPKIQIVSQLSDAGFRAAAAPGPDVDYVVIIHNAGGIWVRDDDPDLTRSIVGHLLEQEWCGPIFTRGGQLGTLPLAAVDLDHPRAPTIAVTLRNFEHVNAHGSAGATLHDAPYPDGGGCHGGLSRYELGNFLSLSGRLFKSCSRISVPANNTDIAPTVLAGLGETSSQLDGFDGRVLREAFADDNDDAETHWHEETIAATNTTGPRTHLSFSRVGQTRYLNQAWLTH